MYKVFLRANHVSKGVVFLVYCKNGCIWNFCVFFYLNSKTNKKDNTMMGKLMVLYMYITKDL